LSIFSSVADFNLEFIFTKQNILFFPDLLRSLQRLGRWEEWMRFGRRRRRRPRGRQTTTIRYF